MIPGGVLKAFPLGQFSHRTVHIRLEGLVQVVGYRAWVDENCHQLGLTGWVRNRRDGSVEAVLHGPEPVVSKMLRLCEVGPFLAEVSRLEIIDEINSTHHVWAELFGMHKPSQ